MCHNTFRIKIFLAFSDMAVINFNCYSNTISLCSLSFNNEQNITRYNLLNIFSGASHNILSSFYSMKVIVFIYFSFLWYSFSQVMLVYYAIRFINAMPAPNGKTFSSWTYKPQKDLFCKLMFNCCSSRDIIIGKSIYGQYLTFINQSSFRITKYSLSTKYSRITWH